MAAYYNENDPKTAAWLRALIDRGLIADGDVDDRSITDVSPSDLVGYDQCHFFAGIGGWSYALRLAGWADRRVVWTGSCPCQPFSAAGKGRGKDDARHLWPQFRRLIRQCRPPVVFGEQVASQAGRVWLSAVFADLEALAYRTAGADLCGPCVGAFDIRQRLWFMADTERRPAERRRHDVAGPSQGTTGQAWQRQRFWANAGSGGDAGGVADTSGQRRDRQRVCLQRREPRQGGLEVDWRSEAGDMGHASGSRLAFGDGLGRLSPAADGPSQGQGAEPAGDPGWVAESACTGLYGRRDGCDDAAAARPSGELARSSDYGFWGAAEWIPCTDGKSRPVEPGTFPLAHGVPARVGRLRGYGNAIKPQVAAEFIAAYMEATA